MNSYNENLQNTVAATLQSQNLDLQSLESEYTSAMYTLYYAEGATLTAAEKLTVAQGDMNDKAKVKEQAVKNMSISANQLNSATQANTYNGQGVTNMATCAANVQIAANGITRLAADVGSIFSIVNAADFGTDIYNQTNQVKILVDMTAYNAELTSQTAMEASAYTAQVSASTVMNDAKATNALMGNILQIASGDYNTATQTVATDNATLATASTSEKLAEGAFESADIDLMTGVSAYQSVNSGLNLNLTAIPLSADKFVLSFKLIKAAFPPPLPPASGEASPNTAAAQQSTAAGVIPIAHDWYPVKDYYAFVVKQSKQLTFTISDAENIRTNAAHLRIKIADEYIPIIDEVVVPGPGWDTIVRTIDYNKVPGKDDKTYKLMDSDGDLIKPGDNYVVFVMAVYQDSYKRLINNFDDFLSAPSLSFTMTTQLKKVDSGLIDVISLSMLTQDGLNDADNSSQRALANLKEARVDITKITDEANDAKHLLLFFTEEQPADVKVKIKYNCMYLPVHIHVPQHILTQPELVAFTTAQIKADQITIQDERQIIKTYLDTLTKAQTVKPAKQKGADNADKTPPSASNDVSGHITLLKAKLDQLEATKKDTENTFFFNADLAEIVPAGNFTTAKQLVVSAEDGTKTHPNLWYAFIGPATTDNFGNLVTDNADYAPVILTLPNSDDPDQIDEYTNQISDFETVKTFTY